MHRMVYNFDSTHEDISAADTKPVPFSDLHSRFRSNKTSTYDGHQRHKDENKMTSHSMDPISLRTEKVSW